MLVQRVEILKSFPLSYHNLFSLIHSPYEQKNTDLKIEQIQLHQSNNETIFTLPTI